MDRRQKAEEFFHYGYNCAQSVVLAYEDILGVDKDTLLKLSAPFGGGVGRLREICGAVSGGVMVLGMVTGLDNLCRSSHRSLCTLRIIVPA